MYRRRAKVRACLRTLATALDPGMCLLALPVIFEFVSELFSSRVPESGREALPSRCLRIGDGGCSHSEIRIVSRILQIVKRLCAADDCFKISFVPCKPRIEKEFSGISGGTIALPSGRSGCRSRRRNWSWKPPKHVRKARCPDERRRLQRQEDPDRLLLGQDQSAFRGRGDQSERRNRTETSRCDQIAGDAPEIRILLERSPRSVLQFLDMKSGLRADCDLMFL